MGFNPEKAQQDIAPSFKFMRINDGLQMLITDVEDEVEIEDKFDGTLKGTGKFLAIKGQVLKAVGGNVDDDDVVTDVPVGELRSVLAQYEYMAVGKESFSNRPSLLAKAIAQAMTEAGVKELVVGGELVVQHSELGKRNADNPSWNRPKFYTARYTPPAKGTSALAAAADAEPAAEEPKYKPF